MDAFPTRYADRMMLHVGISSAKCPVTPSQEVVGMVEAAGDGD
jgi:hypothetical protein